jgi:hypothetical protein
MREAPWPGFGNPASPGTAASGGYAAGGEQADVFVYRDTGEPEEQPAPRPGAQANPAPPVASAAEVDEREAAYWYGIVEPEQPEPKQETRGPFEPLVSSSSLRSDTAPAEASNARAALDDVPEEAVDPHVEKSEKLERIKDLYLTAEAIGEENVDKHFDLLLAQQRELISQYFKQSGIRAETSEAMDPAAAMDPAGAQAPATEGETTQAGAASTGTEW